MRQRVATLTSVLGLTLGTVVLGSGIAHAADPVTVGLSDVKTSTDANASTLTGVLTLRSKSDVQVDPSSLKVTVDGKEYPATINQAPKRDRKAILVIDTSGSMGAQGMATVRSAARTYLKTVPADVKVGVASFADTAGVDLPPTLDRAAAQRVINGLVARGDTSLYDGVQDAAVALGTTGDRSIVLLSDGADTMAVNKALALKNTVTRLQGRDIRVDVVAFKTSDPDATNALKAFAAASGGSVVSASNSAAVSSAFQTSAQALNRQVQWAVEVPETLTGQHKYEISGKAGDTDFDFAKTVAFGTPPAPAPTGTPAATPVATPPAAAQGQFSLGSVDFTDKTPLIASLALALALFLLTAIVLMPSLQTRRERRVASIDEYVASSGMSFSRKEIKAVQSSLATQLVDLGERVMADRKSTSKTMALIERADLPFRAGEWLLLRVVAVIVGASLGFLLAGDAKLLGLAAGAVLGIIAMPIWLRIMANRRANKFEAQLPGLLTLISTSLRSGFGLPQALEAVAQDAAEPAGKEFRRALAETRIGTDISDALDRVAARMDSQSMHWTVLAIRIQREVGGNLAETLRTTAGTLRERESLRRQVNTLSAEGRLSAYILIGLPILLFFYMLRANYAYVSLLWTHPLGLIMSAAGLVALIIGIFWMRQVVKIEV
ncbi:type II secretion system F family protein [Monashia sp. NPDC004114]